MAYKFVWFPKDLVEKLIGGDVVFKDDDVQSRVAMATREYTVFKDLEIFSFLLKRGPCESPYDLPDEQPYNKILSLIFRDIIASKKTNTYLLENGVEFDFDGDFRELRSYVETSDDRDIGNVFDDIQQMLAGYNKSFNDIPVSIWETGGKKMHRFRIRSFIVDTMYSVSYDLTDYADVFFTIDVVNRQTIYTTEVFFHDVSAVNVFRVIWSLYVPKEQRTAITSFKEMTTLRNVLRKAKRSELESLTSLKDFNMVDCLKKCIVNPVYLMVRVLEESSSCVNVIWETDTTFLSVQAC